MTQEDNEEGFYWHRTHKIDEWVEREMIECVWDYVSEFYGVEEVTDLSNEQICEIEAFREELFDHHPLQYGFSWLISTHESETWEMEQENEN
jgi:hypothetical protein